MDALSVSLVIAAAVLGLTGAAHCLAMCAAPCTALCKQTTAQRRGDWRRWASLLAARAFSYAAAGALAAGLLGAAAQWSATSRVLTPLWTLLQLATVLVALWWLATGRPLALLQPATLAAPVTPITGWTPLRVVRRAAQRPALIGLLWAAWPCALLHSALLLAALAPTALGGAAVMAAFALASTPGLLGLVGLAGLRKAFAARGVLVQGAQWQAGALRLSGALLLALAALGWSGQMPSPLFCST
jgi:uncharacterized protein